MLVQGFQLVLAQSPYVYKISGQVHESVQEAVTMVQTCPNMTASLQPGTQSNHVALPEVLHLPSPHLYNKKWDKTFQVTSKPGVLRP